VRQFVEGVPELDFEWFRRRSPMDVRGVTTGDFLSAVFEPGDKVLIFTRYYSQGDFVFWHGRGFFRLSEQEGVAAVPADAPKTAMKGVWYLVQPVSARWEIGSSMADGKAKMTRRSEANVVAWRHVVLESDELAPELWLRVVAKLGVPIVALYTSGGRSIHALVRYPVGTKAQWDQVKGTIAQVVCPLGADPGALSAVRLSRLPGCFREGADGDAGYVKYTKPRLQELIYLNPRPTFESIFASAEVRE
jgi:hypothetical protein